MNTTNEILIHASPETIFQLAADTTDWTRILPHYRFVRVLSDDGIRRTLHMGARRDRIPVAWVAEQTNLAHVPEIRFTHIRGWTRGMQVAWNFIPEPAGTRVIISHRLDFRFPIAARWIADHVIGDFFVKNIADKTLARIKTIAERNHA
jgi:ribosome-associated toxin RatA of RatAB toxin-antitoxin module